MFWSLLRKELLANLLTLRLAVAFACTAGLVALTTFIGSQEYFPQHGGLPGRVQAGA